MDFWLKGPRVNLSTPAASFRVAFGTNLDLGLVSILKCQAHQVGMPWGYRRLGRILVMWISWDTKEMGAKNIKVISPTSQLRIVLQKNTGKLKQKVDHRISVYRLKLPWPLWFCQLLRLDEQKVVDPNRKNTLNNKWQVEDSWLFYHIFCDS